ncbi:glycoside hydrolase family 3 N-terminal domain-containing protein [Microbacterium sp. NPDC019599]|uniref:glycoside hydrolase family 3 N-terminal domain-containing protein n=1 Tax=Microbacterium sp. NPDC019599 TaxID=3154690 RepID=UPI003404B490
MTVHRRLRAIAGAVALAAVAGLTACASAPSAAPTGAAAPAPTVEVSAAPEDSIPARAAAAVGAMSLREKAAAVVMGHIPTTDPAALSDYMERTGIGGFILMGANIPPDEGALRGVTEALAIDPSLPPLIAVDQEGGDVSRLPWDAFPSALTLKDEPAEAAADAFSGRGALVQRAGIGVNFGIVADVTDDPSMFIYRRALGTTPDASAERVAAAVTGEAGQAFSTLKHFPGHGAAPGDSHSVIPSTDLSKQDWAASDAVPFQAGIDAGAELLMFGHLVYTSVDDAPATLSPEWHRIAREELGFEGVIVTDDLGMLQASGIPEYQDPVRNAVMALAAGSDLLLTVVGSTADTAPRIVDGIVAAVESGDVPSERLDDAATRVTALRLEAAASGRGLVPCEDCAPAG